MQVVLRRYRIRFGAMQLAARHAREALLPRLRQVPGFQAYYLVNGGNGLVACIGFFETQEGASAGDRLMADFFRDDWPAFRAVPPELTSGEVLVAHHMEREVEVAAGIPRLERRQGVERRGPEERRSGRERRASPEPAVAAGQGR